MNINPARREKKMNVSLKGEKWLKINLNLLTSIHK